MISIIIPAYNAAETIKQCLESIFNQTYRDFEIIIVNDGSTDKTQEIISGFTQAIHLINQTNNGANAARNRGFQHVIARSTSDEAIPRNNGWDRHAPQKCGARDDKYLIFCDADIVMRPDMLEKMVHVLGEHPENSYAYSSFKFGRKTFKLWPFSAERLRQMPYIHTTSLIRASHFPCFDENIKRLQDWDLWLTMLEQGHTGAWIPETLFKIINTKGTMSQWIPSFLHKIPWKWLGIQPQAILRYNEAVARIKAKHRLT